MRSWWRSDAGRDRRDRREAPDAGEQLPQPPRLEAARRRRAKELRAQGLYEPPNVSATIPPHLRTSAAVGAEPVFGQGGGVTRPAAGIVARLQLRQAEQRAAEQARVRPRRRTIEIGAVTLATLFVLIVVVDVLATGGRADHHTAASADTIALSGARSAALVFTRDPHILIAARADNQAAGATLKQARGRSTKVRRHHRSVRRAAITPVAHPATRAVQSANTATPTHTSPSYTSQSAPTQAPAAAATQAPIRGEASGTTSRSNQRAGPSGSNPLGGIGTCVKGC